MRSAKIGLEHTLTAEDEHCVSVVPGRTPTLGRADMLRYVDARLDSGDERVLHTSQPHLIGSPLFLSGRLCTEHAYVVR